MNKKHEFISIATIICMYAVVQLHTNEIFWIYSESILWESANIVESICYFAVPVFFMITGSTLIGFRKRYSIKTYLIKRTRKVIVPYLIWSLIGLVFRVAYVKDVMVSQISLGYIIRGYYHGSHVGIYWFFPVLIIEYIIIIFLEPIIKDKKNLITFTLLLFLIGPCLDFYIHISNTSHGALVAMIIKLSGYTLYCIIGYAITSIIEMHGTLPQKMKVPIFIVGAIGLCVHIIGTSIYSSITTGISELFKGYYNLPAFFYSVAVYLFIIDLVGKAKDNRCFMNNSKLLICVRGGVHRLIKYSFAVYLLQYYVMEMLKISFHVSIKSTLYRFIGPPFVIIFCVLICLVLRKTWIGRFIIPK